MNKETAAQQSERSKPSQHASLSRGHELASVAVTALLGTVLCPRHPNGHTETNIPRFRP